MTTVPVNELANKITRLFAQKDIDRDLARSIFADLRKALGTGQVRAAEPDLSTSIGWKVNEWVKKGILLGFRSGDIVAYPSQHAGTTFLDKDTLPLKSLDNSFNVRVVP